MSVPVISKECLVSEDLEEKSGTYRIEISNFLNKYRNAEKGQEVSTKKFFLSWSEFSLQLYIRGDNQSDGEHLSLFLVNHSDWMVRAGLDVHVKGKYLVSTCLPGRVLKSSIADSGKIYGRHNCIPLYKCLRNASHSDEVLTIEVKVRVLAENIPGGGGDVQRQLSIMNKTLEKFLASKKEISILHGKLAAEQPQVQPGQTGGRDGGVLHGDSQRQWTEAGRGEERRTGGGPAL